VAPHAIGSHVLLMAEGKTAGENGLEERKTFEINYFEH
jgi:hypothetical protein